MSGRRRPLLVSVGVLVMLVVVAFVLDADSRGPSGPPSSSYSTTPEGVAAWAALLGRFDHAVARTGSLAFGDLDADSTLVLLDAGELDDESLGHLATFVDSGGRLVAGGSGAAAIVEVVTGGARPQGSSTTVLSHVAAPVLETTRVSEVSGAGAGGWSSPELLLPILVDDSTVVAGIATSTVAPDRTGPDAVGGGRLVAVADATVFDNEHLPLTDNAAFALAVVGEPGRPVVFSEGQHGYQGSDGLGAIPGDWRWFLAGTTAAALVWMLARSRRVGEPDQPRRELPPPRAEFVEAIAAGLARRKESAALAEAFQTRCRSLVARRAGLPTSASVDSIGAAAPGLGLEPDEVEALRAPDPATVDLLVIGRAHARLHRGSDPADRGPS